MFSPDSLYIFRNYPHLRSYSKETLTIIVPVQTQVIGPWIIKWNSLLRMLTHQDCNKYHTTRSSH